MLAAVENSLIAVLRAAVSAGVNVQAGPVRDRVTELIALCAQRLVLLPSTSEQADPEAARAGARLLRIETQTADGTKRDFGISQAGELTEVESPPGRVLTPGDDYLVSGRTVNLFVPPPRDQVIAFHLLGESVRGYTEKLPCRIEISLTVYASAREQLDALLATGLSAILRALVELPRIEAELPKDSGVRMRLLRPSAGLAGIQRSAGLLEKKEFLMAVAQFVLHGDLETTVAMGGDERTGTIKQVDVQPDRSSKRFIR